MEYKPDETLTRVDDILKNFVGAKEADYVEAANLLLTHDLIGLAWDAESDGFAVGSIAARRTRIPTLVGELIELRKSLVTELNDAYDPNDVVDRTDRTDLRRVLRGLWFELDSFWKASFRDLGDVLPASRLDLMAVQLAIGRGFGQ